MSTNFSRRNFLSSCAVCGAGLSLYPMLGSSMSFTMAPVLSRPKVKPVVKTIFAYPDPAGPIWPNIGYDFDAKIAEYKQKLLAECPEVDFRFLSTMAGSAAEAKRIVDEDHLAARRAQRRQ